MAEEIMKIIKDINPYEEFDVRTDLIEEEILDSLGIMLLITELENKYTIEISLENLEISTFKNIESIVDLVKRSKD